MLVPGKVPFALCELENNGRKEWQLEIDGCCGYKGRKGSSLVIGRVHRYVQIVRFRVCNLQRLKGSNGVLKVS